jgi:hypothetical protein
MGNWNIFSRMEIIEEISNLFVMLIGIAALSMMLMLFTYYLGGLMTSLFEG